MLMKSTVRWILIAILIFNVSCSKKNPSETDRWEEFYIRLLFIECSAFTIYGTKPMTELILDHRSKDEKDKSREKYLLGLSDEERKAKETSDKISWNPKYDFEETWRLWESQLNKDHINNYIIAHFPRNAGEFDFVYIINIVELATVLKEHYCLFQKYLGFEFDPLEAVFEIQNPNSIFWNRLFNAEPTTPEKICLMGILFGYGIENSYPFSLVFNNEREGHSKKFTTHLLKLMTENMKPKDLTHFSSTEFSIPGFRTFSPHSYTQVKYENEKEEIIDYYKGKNLSQATLELLYR